MQAWKQEVSMDEKVAFSTYLPRDLQKEIKHLSVDTGRPVHDLVTDAIREYLERNREQSIGG
jgi:predicted DNA-binding protein